MRATKPSRYLSRRISRASQKNVGASPSSTFHANSTAKPPAGQRAVGRRKLADLPLDCHQSNHHSDCSRCADRTVERVQQRTVILSAGLRADAQAMNKELPLRSTVKGGETDCPEYPRVEHVLVLARQARRRAGKCPTDSGSGRGEDGRACLTRARPARLRGDVGRQATSAETTRETGHDQAR
jgi:hypothetical protein